MPNQRIPSTYRISTEVSHALQTGRPVVALESTVITHGLPHPENLSLALDMEATVRQEQAVPATIAVIDGLICVGVNQAQLERLSRDRTARKISRRDFAPAIAQKASGGTTVAGTMLAASTAGIGVFATGGIGGVHRQPAFDISADLPQLASTPMIVVCAGAKAILDLPATLEYLETAAVPVVGYQTDEFPAFFSPSSGLNTSARADSPAEVVAIAQAHWGLGLSSAVLVAAPPPEETAMQPQAMHAAIEAALQEAEAQGIRGQQSTPFLLQRVSELSNGASLKANLELLKNNARIAAQIAGELAGGKGWQPA
ncbi:MAG: pseudouridine-5'-phosphate glycosidase [Chloroflexota bacterium]